VVVLLTALLVRQELRDKVMLVVMVGQFLLMVVQAVAARVPQELTQEALVDPAVWVKQIQ
tara:strand:- start:252 stop:431 length:180 start_codon:yes stop_codon:yes gene_type:complete